ncbi:hypothetical protein [Fusobacterium pseudoperiodonticum]|uniref:hypothetical protein n=1 Tax=Fusobacterium pseudoperiodonticum TaxID=2663009 RepID=UPI0028D01E0C|nr:hypothetical protein [Fusobacterium pseudoperiodonticum]
MNKEILKIQAARFGIHLIKKLPYILNNGLSYELLYDILKKYGPHKVYNEIKLCFKNETNLSQK